MDELSIPTGTIVTWDDETAIEFTRFFSTYLFSMILGLILLPFLVEVIGIDPKISGALLIPITALISYIGHSRFSFRK
jgi:putative flippase GtrA